MLFLVYSLHLYPIWPGPLNKVEQPGKEAIVSSVP